MQEGDEHAGRDGEDREQEDAEGERREFGRWRHGDEGSDPGGRHGEGRYMVQADVVGFGVEEKISGRLQVSHDLVTRTRLICVVAETDKIYLGHNINSLYFK